MKSKIGIARVLSYLFVFAAVSFVTHSAPAAPPRSAGTCDIYGAANTPCIAAHSTTRALFAAYKGPLYQVKRESDGRTLDIGVAKALGADSGGYADAAAQDAFCAGTICVINLIYDQSGHGNHLLQGAPGTFKGPAKGAFDTQPIADMAPITIAGHKAYGVFMMPGMGFRNNNASGIAVGDEPEGIYYVVDGTHYDSGCCFDYGNSSTNGRAVGTGTMETTYFGTSTVWGSGKGNGPWIMSDMEAGLFSGHSPKQNLADPTIDSWRFVTAVVDGGGGNRWDLRGGSAQQGGLTTFYRGERPGDPDDGRYYPMHKQGGILLGTGGDNGNGSSGTFYEGVMTIGYPTEATTDAVQANIVAARYEVQRIGLSRVKTFTPHSTQDVTATFTNTTGVPVKNVALSVAGPTKLWTAAASGKTFAGRIAPGTSVTATFTVTSPGGIGGGVLTAKAEWENAVSGRTSSDAISARVRNVPAVKINEVQLGARADTTDQFIELYNAAAETIDISGWSISHTPSQWATIKLATIPPGTKLASHGFYLLGLAASGLSAPASAGATTIQVRTTEGFEIGQDIKIDGELRKIASIGTAAAPMTTIFIPVSTGPRITIPAGSASLPVTSAAGFEIGQKIGIDVGGRFEVAKVTAVGKGATQTTLAAAAQAGATNIKLANDANIVVGDALTIGTAAHKEVAKVTKVGGAGAAGSGVDLVAALKFDHAASIDVSDPGTGIHFTPATRFVHISGDSVQALGSGITLDKPLVRSHVNGAPVAAQKITIAGYQGQPMPNLWFGSPLSAAAGSLALMDGPVVVDAMVYGSQQSNSSANGTIVSPELAVLEGDQGKGGCIAVSPAAGKSEGRFPDGADTDSNCNDFETQAATTLALASSVSAGNVKVANVDGFKPGLTITIDSGANAETAVIATVGTPGATTTSSAITPAATSLPVSSASAFRPGQTITIGEGLEEEAAVVVGTGRRGAQMITVAAPLKFAHAAGTHVSGSGITLTAPLNRAHSEGSQITDNVPTPGAPNKY